MYTENDDQDVNKKKSPPIFLVLIAGILALALLVVGVVWGIRVSYDPVDTVIAMTDEFNVGNYKKMLRYIDPSEAKLIRKGMELLPEEIPKDAMEIVFPFLADISGVKLYPEVVQVTQEKRRAVVTVKFRNLDEEHYYDVYLRRKNLCWYVQYAWVSDSEVNSSK